MARGKWPFGGQNGHPTPQPQDAAKAVSALAITTADGKKFGFENYCNNCYVNSVVQALYFCAPFRDLMLQASDPSAALAASSCQQPPGAAQVTTPATTPAAPLTPIRRKPERKNSTLSASDTTPATNGSTPPPTVGAPIPPAPPSLFSALRSLFYHISTNPNQSGTVAPKAFIDKLKEMNQMFNNTSHQDAHEFLNYLLNQIVEEVEAERKNSEAHVPSGTPPPGSEDLSNSLATLNSNSGRSKEDATLVHKLFEGVLTSETRCLTCENVSSRDESFLDLSIDIEQNSSVTACLRSFSASEMLCNKNKFFCDSCCDLQEAEKRMKIKRLPNILALHLKRFKYQEETNRYVKLSYRVAFPFELRLFNTVDDVEEGDRDRLYELFGIVVHIGNGPHHGHYVSIIKTLGTWLLFDDETVTPIAESDIPNYYGESAKGSAYVLYYQAVDIDMAKLGLRKEVVSDPALLTIKEKDIQRDGLPLRVGNGQLPPPPGLDALEQEAPGSNGSAAYDPTTPTISPHPLPPTPSSHSQNGRQSTESEWTHISSSTNVSNGALAPSSVKGVANFLGLKSLRKTPSVSIRTGLNSIIGTGSSAAVSSPNISVPSAPLPAPPPPPVLTTVSEPISASVSTGPSLPLEPMKVNPTVAPTQAPSQPAPPVVSPGTDSVTTPRLAPKPHPRPALPVPPLNGIEKAQPTPQPAVALQRSTSQRKASGHLSPPRPQTSPGISRPSTSPRPLPPAPRNADTEPPPPVPTRPVTSQGLDAASKATSNDSDKDAHRRSINTGQQLPEAKKEKRNWLRRSFRLGDKSKSPISTQQQVEAGLVPPSPSLGPRGSTVPGVLNIAGEDNLHIPSPASSTSSNAPLRVVAPQQRKVSAPESADTSRGHQRTPSADRPPSAYSHSGVINGTSIQDQSPMYPSPSPASSTFESSAYTHESDPKLPSTTSHTHSGSRSALPQPPITHPPQHEHLNHASSPIIAPSRSPLLPVPGLHSLPPTPSSPEFASPSKPFGIRTPTRKTSLAVAGEAHVHGSASGSPERKKSMPSFAAFRHKDKGVKSKEKVWDALPNDVNYNISGGTSSADQSGRSSHDRPLPAVPTPVLTHQQATYTQHQNGIPAVIVNEPEHFVQNGHAIHSDPHLDSSHFPSYVQTHDSSNRHHPSYVIEADDHVPVTLGPARRTTIAAQAPAITNTHSQTGSATSSASSNFKRATRKLSLTAPMLGFGRRDKEKDKKPSAPPTIAPSAFQWSA